MRDNVNAAAPRPLNLNLNPIAPPQAQPAPIGGGQPPGERGYVAVHNLHRGNGYASLFRQVNPDQTQLKARLGEKALKYISFENDAQGVPQARLRLKEASTEKAAKANAEAVKHEFAAARDALWNTTQEFDEQLQVIQREERQQDLAVKPFYARWFGKLRDLFHGAPPPVSLELKFVPGQVEHKEHLEGRLVIGTTDVAGRRMLAEGQAHAAQQNAAAARLQPNQEGGEPGAAPVNAPGAGAGRADGAGVVGADEVGADGAPGGAGIGSAAAKKYKTDGFDGRHGKSRAAWLTLGGTVGLLGGGLMVTAGTVAAAAGSALLAPLVLAGGGLVVGGLVLKAAFGKTPWWGKTATGQLQHAERQMARELAGQVADAVKQQVLRGSQADANVEVPHGQLHKRFVLDDPKMVSDFVRLAREKNHEGLKKLVKAELQKTDRSFLNEDTIAKSKIGWLRGLWPPFSGNQSAHARKTMDIAVREVVRGIEQGVAEGVLQTVVGELVDAQSVKAEKEINKAVQKRFNDFQGAVAKLDPKEGDDFHEIFEVDQHTAALKRLQVLAGSEADRLAPTREAVKALHKQIGVIGNENFENFRDGLLKLDHDIQAHIDSLRDARGLLLAPENPNPGQDPPAHLDGMLAGMVQALADVQQDDPGQVRQTYDALQGELQQLRDKLADGNQTAKLIKAHADKLKGLFDQSAAALGQARIVSETLSTAHQAFRNTRLTMEDVNARVATLTHLESHALQADMDPTKKGKVNASIGSAQGETKRLLALSDGLQKAQEASAKLGRLSPLIRQLAATSGLEAALRSDLMREFKAEIQSQQAYIKEWEDAKFHKPDALKRWSPADIKQLQVDLVADAFKLNEAQRVAFKPLIERLAGLDSEKVDQLAAVQNPEHRVQLLTALNAHLPPDGAAAESDSAQEAALACLTAALGTSVVIGPRNEGLVPLIQALHPSQTALLQKYSRALEAEATLWNAFHGELGNALSSWVEDKALIDQLPLLPGAGLLQPFNSARKLQEMEAFIKAHPDLEGGAQMLETLKNANSVWGSGKKLGEQTSAEQREGLSKVDAEALSRLQGMAQALTAPLNKAAAESKARRRHMELQAQALQQQAANQIAPGKGDDPVAVQAAVRNALQAKAPELAQPLGQIGSQIQQIMGQLDVNRDDRDIQAQRLKNLAEGLRNLLGSPDKGDVLIQRIVNQPQLRAELGALIYAQTALGGAEVPELFSSALTAKGLVDAAAELAKFNRLSEVNQAALADSFKAGGQEQEWTRLKTRLDERDKHLQTLRGLKKDAQGNILPNEIRKALTRQPGLEDFVRSYHDEGLAYAKLWKAAGQPEKNNVEVRAVVEGSATLQEDRLVAASLNRATVRGGANCTKVKAGVREILENRREAVTGLRTLLKERYEPHELKYLEDQTAALDRALDQLENIDALEAFSNPGSGQLAALGALIRECEPFIGKAKSDIQNAYLKEQVTISRKALRWFDLKHFSQAQGLFSKVLFTLVGKGKRLNNLFAEGQSSRALDIAKTTTQISSTHHHSQELKKQGETLKLMLIDLQGQRNAMVKDPKVAINALRMLAAQHLATKEDLQPRLNDQDREVVLTQWKALVGQDAVNTFPDIGWDWAALFNNNTVAGLVGGLSEQDRVQVESRLLQLQEKDQATRRAHQAFREAVNAADIKASRGISDSARELRQLLVRAGLDATALSVAETALGNKEERISLFKDLLTDWAFIRQDLAAGGDLRPLVLRATEVKNRLQDLVADISVKNRRDLMRSLIQDLEYTLLEGMGMAAPVALPSIDGEVYTQTYGVLQELREATKEGKKPDPTKFKPAALKGREPSGEYSLSEFPYSTAQGVAQAERHLMAIWSAASHGFKNADQGSRSPPQWRLMDRLAESRLQLAIMCEELAKQADAQPVPKKDADKLKEEAKKRQVQRLKARAMAHRQAALISAAWVGRSMQQWAASPSFDGLPLPSFSQKIFTQQGYWQAEALKAGFASSTPENVLEADIKAMSASEELAFGKQVDQTTDKFARGDLNEGNFGGFIEPASMASRKRW